MGTGKLAQGVSGANVPHYECNSSFRSARQVQALG